jgi:hypothetical protein
MESSKAFELLPFVTTITYGLHMETGNGQTILIWREVTSKAGLKVGDMVKQVQYIGDEDALGCAMLKQSTLR